MKLGRICGKVWATAKDPQLHGVWLKIMQPVDEHKKDIGKKLIAADTIGVSNGDYVFWVGGGEATRAFPNRQIPSDVTIIGLVERLDI